MPLAKRKVDVYEEDWLTTYADAITLVMIFLLTMISISKIDITKLEEMSASFASELGKKDIVKPISLLESQIQQILADVEISSDVSVTKDSTGVVIEFPGKVLFQSGTEITPNAAKALSEIALTSTAPRYRHYVVEVQGHSNPNQAAQPFPSAWEMTTARASRVVRFFAQEGIQSTRLIATGYADGNPKLPEIEGPKIERTGTLRGTSEQQKAAEKARRDAIATLPMPDNDRVVIRIHPPIDPETGLSIIAPPEQPPGAAAGGKAKS